MFAVGTDRFSVSLKEELPLVQRGGAVFTGPARRLRLWQELHRALVTEQQALAAGFAVADSVQVSEKRSSGRWHTARDHG